MAFFNQFRKKIVMYATTLSASTAGCFVYASYLNDDTEQYVNLAIELFKSNYFEEKEIAIRMLNKRVKLKNKLHTINEKHLSLLGGNCL